MSNSKNSTASPDSITFKFFILRMYTIVGFISFAGIFVGCVFPSEHDNCDSEGQVRNCDGEKKLSTEWRQSFGRFSYGADLAYRIAPESAKIPKSCEKLPKEPGDIICKIPMTMKKGKSGFYLKTYADFCYSLFNEHFDPVTRPRPDLVVFGRPRVHTCTFGANSSDDRSVTTLDPDGNGSLVCISSRLRFYDCSPNE